MLKQILLKKKLDAILVSSVPNIVYLTGYSGFSKDEREAYLFICKNKQYIITDGRYSEAVRVHIPHFELIERTIHNTTDDIFKKLMKKHKIKRLGIEENNLTVSEYKKIKRCFNDLNHFSISSIRAIKTQDEILAIEQTCKLGDKTFSYILKKIKKGISEKEVAFELEMFIKKNGGELSFPTIVAFGKNSATPHHQTSNERLSLNRHSGKPKAHPESDSGQARMTPGQFVLLDFGVKLNNYCSDMTRTVFFGKPTSEQKKMYETVLIAQTKAMEYLKKCHSERSEESRSFDKILQDNIWAKEVDKVARDYITSQGYPSIPHSLGHGIGIEVHESPSLSPNSKEVLKEGMVFSIEPGIYIPGFGGVRMEDLVVLKKTGPRILTTSSSLLTLVG